MPHVYNEAVCHAGGTLPSSVKIKLHMHVLTHMTLTGISFAHPHKQGARSELHNDSGQWISAQQSMSLTVSENNYVRLLTPF